MRLFGGGVAESNLNRSPGVDHAKHRKTLLKGGRFATDADRIVHLFVHGLCCLCGIG